MKKLSIYLFLILFSFQTLSLSSGIKDFEIEGISIGDNLLDHYTLKEINNAYVYKYKNDEFRYYILDVRSGTTYDYLQITVKSIHKNVIKPSDKLKIHSVAGIIRYKFNIDDCYPVQNRIKEELDSGDFLRELNLGKYDEYHQYINIRNLNEMIGVLMHLEMMTQEIIEVNSDAYTKIQFSTWIYYISLINNYGTLQSLAKLYERQIIFPPQDWQMIGDIANCMLKTKEMTFQLLGQYAEDNNL